MFKQFYLLSTIMYGPPQPYQQPMSPAQYPPPQPPPTPPPAPQGRSRGGKPLPRNPWVKPTIILIVAAVLLMIGLFTVWWHWEVVSEGDDGEETGEVIVTADFKSDEIETTIDYSGDAYDGYDDDDDTLEWNEFENSEGDDCKKIKETVQTANLLTIVTLIFVIISIIQTIRMRMQPPAKK